MFLTETERKDLSKFLQFFLTYQRTLLIGGIVGIVLGGGITFFQSNQYTSKTTIFAVNYSDWEKNQANIPFGLDIHADQLMQIMISNRLRDSVIQHLNLKKYYKSDMGKKDWRETLYHNWDKDVKMRKTRFLSIEIEVETIDPQLSADIANQIVSYASKIYNDMLDENERSYMESIGVTHDKQFSFLSYLTDSLKKSIAEKKDSFLLNRLKREIYVHQTLIEELKKQYEYNKARYEKKTLVLNVIEKAVPAGRKSSPSFILNIIIGATLGLIFTIIGTLILGFYKKTNP